MSNRAPTTRVISALLATALLLNSVAASGLTDCSCRASDVCCCSQAKGEPGSSRSCCGNRVESRNSGIASHKTTKRRPCCRGGTSDSRESGRHSSGCSCGCRQNIPAPAVPVENNRSAEKLAIDLAASVSVATVFQLFAPRQPGNASAELNAVTALDRCACLCRFTL